MRRSDFYACTPMQFTKIVEVWNEERQALMRDGWERTRFFTACMLQPYSKNTLRPRDIALFPWERENEGDEPERQELSMEEKRRRFEEARKRWGLD